MATSGKKSSLVPPTRFQRLWAFVDDFSAVFYEQKQPTHVALHYHRECLALLWMYPNDKECLNKSYRMVHYFLLTHLAVTLLAMMCSVQDAIGDVVELGEHLVWIIGISFIKSKMWYIHFRANEIDRVIAEFERFNRKFWHTKDNVEILQLQRHFFIGEFLFNTSAFVLLFIFNVPICLQPLWSHQPLPFHTKYPFEWHNSAKHPLIHLGIYFSQIFMSFHNLNTILPIDLLGVHSFTQTTLNLRILCMKLRTLVSKADDDEHDYDYDDGSDTERFRASFREIVQYHQQIIRVVERTNRAFNGTFIVQIVASFVLISLSTFETFAAKDDPKAAARFELFVLLTFIQLSAWCLAGDMVHSQSTEVAYAAFDMPNWHKRRPAIQRDLRFVIQRAQKPLVYAAKPFMAFTLATYTIILKQCYTILALLREALH